ncbi:MAG: Ycf66 family protein [Waterburya sp.]
MLSYALAIAVALSSLVLFSTAFVMSDIHRQDDFLWSGIGLFYALVLWFCARNITGAVLLGQAAAASLLVSYNWQTLKLRKAIVNPSKASTTNNFSVLQKVSGLLKRNQPQPQVTTTSTATTTSDKLTEENIAIPEQTSNQTKSKESNNQPPNSPKSKSQGLGKLFANKKQPSLTNTKLDEVLDEEVTAKTKTNTVATPAIEKNQAESEIIEKIATNQAEEKISNIPESQLEAKSTVDERQSQETISNQQDEQNSSSENSLESKPETTTINPENSVTPPDNQPEKTNLSDTINESTFEATPPEITAQTPTTQPEKRSSSLDSLETVEVAEILEASPEERFGNRESEPIIEVTTTEIKITIEEKTDQSQAQDSDSESPQQS